VRFDFDSIQNYSIRFKKQKIWLIIPIFFYIGLNIKLAISILRAVYADSLRLIAVQCSAVTAGSDTVVPVLLSSYEYIVHFLVSHD
jgi:hypothetical protein